MKSFALALLGSAALASTSKEFIKEQQKLACYIYTDFEFFNIMKLSTEENYQVSAPSGNKYDFNFCKFDLKCPNSEKEALATLTKDGSCLELSGSTPDSIKSESVLTDKKKSEKSLFLTYSKGAQCATDSKKTQELEL